MRLRWWVIAIVSLAAVGATGWAVTGRPTAGPPPAPRVRTTTAAVTRGDVTAAVQVAGVLGFDGAYIIVNQLPGGVVTAVPMPGTTVVRGADLFAVADIPAILLYGTTPAYRGFAAGMTDGADVEQLERNLVALGMDPNHAIAVDRRFTAATTAAIKRWQAARGLPAAMRTGLLPLGQVVFLPGAIRVGEAMATLGAVVGPGEPALSATATARVVRVSLPADRQTLVHAGDPVRVAVPGLPQPVTGAVREIGTVATPPSQGAGPATVPVVVSVTLPAGAPVLDQAPVQVAIAGAQRHNVLLAPVTALLPGPSGGYQVAVVDGGARRLVTVRPGLFDEAAGIVEITGEGLSEGTRVEVPVT